MKLVVPCLMALLAGASIAPGHAAPQASTLQNDKFHITDTERAACQDDAIALCSSAYPNEDLLLACMKANRQQLSDQCRGTFENGLRRRHMPLQ